MPVFEYKALDSTGKQIKGIMDAESETQARSKLRGAGRYPVSIKVSKGRAKSFEKKDAGIGFFERIKAEEIHILTRQLATLLGAGIPLVQSLSSLVDQTSNPALKRVIAQIRGKVNEGATLTRALGDYPKLFSNVYVNMVRAAEASGSLEVVLERLADIGEKQQVLEGRLRAALIYPVFMAIIGSAILFVLITYVVPNITQVFAEMGRVLPWPTRLLIEFSSIMQRFWWLICLGIGGCVFCVRYFVSLKVGRNFWDLMKLKMPVIGPVVRKVLLARFASTLGSLLNSSVGLLTSMQIVKNLIDNVQVAKVLDEAMEDV